ncbi:MAG: beta-lactamase family protein [Faecalibacterium sp.]|jgi:CubicO group peptidase (beta-lactamase class C family)|nr:beta-lactamase family protein [Faecalibacterium sp.]
MELFTQERINQFLTLLKQTQVEVHAITIYQEGRLLLNRAYAPFEIDALHPLYSVSKSFLSIAVGYLVSDRKIDINAPWLTYCPAYADIVADPAFRNVTVRHLLTMSLGQDAEAAAHGDDDWAAAVAGKPLCYEPGTKFFYNSMCSHMLSVLVQTVAGQKVSDLLAERLFAQLGIHDYYWEEDRLGHTTGGFGLHLSTPDLAKFGLCCLNHGVYQGKQIIPAEWLAEATRKQMENASEYPIDRTENRQGYGYQFWMCTHGAYRCSGLHGQMCFIQPENRLVIAMSSATSGSQAILNCLFRAIDYPEAVPQFTDFSIPPIKGIAAGFLDDTKSYRYAALENPARITELEWEQPDGEHIKVTLLRGRERFSFTAGYNEWTRQTNAFENFSKFIAADSIRTMRPEKYAPILFGNYAWLTKTTLQIQLRALDCASKFNFVFYIDRGYLTLHYEVKALYTTFSTFDVVFRR